MNTLKTVLSILGGFVVLIVADCIAQKTAALPGDIPWLMMFHDLVFVGAFGIIAGRLLTQKWWFLAAIGPILYYGHLCIFMQTPMFLWLDSQMLLTVIVALVGAYVGSAIKK